MKRVIKFVWGWALFAEGFMWQYIVNSNIIKNKKLQEKMGFRSLCVSIVAANLLTDGWAFPWAR
ncbi:MAG: hypothetical protein WC495_06675 [Patescibacteria group bacterium]|jgi:hypothetical protein